MVLHGMLRALDVLESEEQRLAHLERRAAAEAQAAAMLPPG